MRIFGLSMARISSLCLSVLLGLTVTVANASHFRGGSISWQALDLDSDGSVDDVTVTMKTVWRSDFVGEPSLEMTPASSPVVQTSNEIIFVGGAETAEDSDYAFQTTIYSISNLDLTTTYSLAYNSNARIGTLENNANGSWYIQSDILLTDGNQSPNLEFPIIYEVSQVSEDGVTPITDWTFDVNALDPDGDSVEYRLATFSELGGGVNLDGLSIDTYTGLMTWQNAGSRTPGLYSAGILAEDIDESGNIKSKTHVDFILDLRNNAAVEFTTPVNVSDSGVVVVAKGDTFEFEFPGSAIDTSGLGTAQSALSEPTDNQYIFDPGVVGTGLDPGVYPITFEIRDTTGVAGNSYYTINFVVPDPEAPIIDFVADDRTPYTTIGSTIVVDVSQDAVVSDTNNPNFDGGSLLLSLANSDYSNETLGIVSEGIGQGQISVSGNIVSYESVPIGTIDSTFTGIGSALKINFISTSATHEAVQSLVQQLSYSNSVALADRDLTIVLEDPDGLSNFYNLYIQVASTVLSTVDVNPETQTADGIAESVVTVQLKDGVDKIFNTSGGTVTLSTDFGTLGPVTDNLDGTYSAVLTAPLTAGVATISAALDGNPLTDTATVNYVLQGSGDQSTLMVDDNAVVVGNSTLVTVQSIDTNGTPLTIGGEPVTISSSSGTVGTVTDNGDGTYSATLTDTVVGIAQVTATVNGELLTDTESVAFTAGPVDDGSAVLSVSTNAARAGDTVIVSIQSKDAFGNDVNEGGGDDVQISTTFGTVSMAIDNGDGTYSATLNSLSSGTSIVSATMNGTAISNTETVEFSAGSPSSQTSTLEVADAIISTDDQTTVTVQSYDVGGNRIGFGGDDVVISTNFGVLGSVTDNGDGSYTAVFNSPLAGEADITATLNGDPINDTETITIVAGAASATNSSLSAQDNTLTTDDSTLLTVVLFDANGNRLTSGGDTVEFYTSLGTVSSVVDNSDGSYEVTLSSTSSGLASVTATVNSAAVSNVEEVIFTAGASSGSGSELSSDKAIASIEETVQVTVQVNDSFGNNLVVGGDTVTIATSLGTLTSVTDNQDGTYTASLSSNNIGVAMLSANVNGEAVANTESVEFIAGSASGLNSTLVVDQQSVSTDETVLVTLQAIDANGNPLLQGGDNVVINTSVGSLSDVIDNGDGTYNAVLSSDSIATALVSATINANSVADTAQVEFTAGDPSGTSSTFSVDRNTQTIDGLVELTVNALDEGGNSLSTGGATVQFQTSLGSVSSVVDHGDGRYTATLSSDVIGVADVSATINAASISPNQQVEFTHGAVEPETSLLSIDKDTLPIDETAIVTVQLVDAGGNPILTGGDDVVLTSDTGELGPVTDNGDGTYSATLQGTEIGPVVVSATINSVPAENTVGAEFLPGAVSPDDSVLSAAPELITTDDTSTVTLQVQDANGNQIPEGGSDVVFETDLGELQGDVVDNGDGTYEITFFSTDVGVATVTATIDGDAVANDVEITITTGAADPLNTVVSLSEDTLVADGESQSTLTIELFDSGNNRIDEGGDDVVVTSDVGELADVIDNQDGSYTVVFTSPSEIEGASTPANFLISVNGESVPPESLTLTIDPDGDEDKDGLTNAQEGFTTDSDEDGIPDLFDPDDDNDGILTIVEKDEDKDGDGIPNHLDEDSDNDRIPDTQEAANIPTLSGEDSDGDGIDDVVDPDATGGQDLDGDGIDDRYDPQDNDGDGLPDYLDVDADNDGIADLLEGGDDSDGDGLPNNADTDSDNDGIPDREENISTVMPIGVDSDNDGIDNAIDVDVTFGIDSNGNGVDDRYEVSDLDKDGVPDLIDLDTDNDGIPDTVEIASSAGLTDHDSDRIPHWRDKDSDNDGITDLVEAGGLDEDGDGMVDNFVDLNNDGLDDAMALAPLPVPDTDKDGVKDIFDLDSDNDGLFDIVETQGTERDQDADGRIDDVVDENYDGVDDTIATVPTLIIDTDLDEIPNHLDLDTDNDGLTDLVEGGSIDNDNDGVKDSMLDIDQDGIPDVVDVDFTGGVDIDGDNIDDSADADFIAEADLDFDGIINSRDPDANGDGAADDQSDRLDPSLGAALPDLDNNGVADVLEVSYGYTTALAGRGCSVSQANGAKDPTLPGLLFISVLALLLRSSQHRKARLASLKRVASRLLLLSTVFSLSACSFLQSRMGAPEIHPGNSKGQFNKHVYVSSGIGVSKLEPDPGTAPDNAVADTSDTGGHIALGVDVNKHLSLEAHTTDLGSAGLSPVGRINYNMHGASALFYAGKNRKNNKRSGVNLYGRLGYSKVENSAEGGVEYQQLNSNSVLFGLGMEYASRNGLGARAELVSFEEDANYAQLALVYRMGAKQSRVKETVAQLKPEAPKFDTTPNSIPAVMALKKTDSDGDGVNDADDQCPSSSPILPIDETGCALFTGVISVVHFGFDSYDLDFDAKVKLDVVAEEMKRRPSLKVGVHAHTDSVGNIDYNQRLSEKRAISVVTYLMESRINRGRLVPQAYGEEVPVVSNATKEGRYNNRRVEIVAIRGGNSNI